MHECNPFSTSLPPSGQVLRVRTAVTSRFEASILTRLMANLSLPTAFTEQVGFSLERAHCHLSSHLQPPKCNTVQGECLRAGLCEVYVSQGRYVSLRGMRSGFFCFSYHVAFDLNPGAWRVSRHRLWWTVVCWSCAGSLQRTLSTKGLCEGTISVCPSKAQIEGISGIVKKLLLLNLTSWYYIKFNIKFNYILALLWDLLTIRKIHWLYPFNG